MDRVVLPQGGVRRVGVAQHHGISRVEREAGHGDPFRSAPSVHGETAVDGQHLSADERRVRGAEEAHGTNQVGG